jgi:hypothetical protein
VDIRFVSSLTAEDEDALAPALLKAIGSLLDQLPITYTVRIETTGERVFQHMHTWASDGATSSPTESHSASRFPVAHPKFGNS